MRLERARPLVQEVALSGFGDDDEFSRRGGHRSRRGQRRRHHHEDDEDDGEVAGRKERPARRRLRRRQRGQRQALKAKQRLNRSRGGRRGKRGRGGDGGSRTSPAPRRPSHSSHDDNAEEAEPSWQRRPLLRRRPAPRRDREQAPIDDDEFIDAEWDEEPFDNDWEAAFEEETLAGAKVELGRAVRRGLLEPGAARRVWDRIRTNVKERVQKRRDERGDRRSERASQTVPAPAAPVRTPGWNPPGAMGTNLRVQARAGHRAAVMELRSGLYLVADVTSEVLMPSTQGEDVGAILPGLMAKAAITAIRKRRERRQNALTALQPRELSGPTSPQLQMHGVAGLPWSD